MVVDKGKVLLEIKELVGEQLKVSAYCSEQASQHKLVTSGAMQPPPLDM
jgi:hypothetical protein